MNEAKGIPHIVLLTKVDTATHTQILEKLAQYQRYQNRYEAIIPFSVTKGMPKEALLDEIAARLPDSPWLFDPEMLTTDTIRDIYKELIREAIFEKTSEEIPYESDVIIEKIDEEAHIDYVYATIVVEKETQKRMIIGKQGAGIKRIGKHARELMERFSGKKIYLDLHVAVRKGWSKNKETLREFGYIA